MAFFYMARSSVNARAADRMAIFKRGGIYFRAPLVTPAIVVHLEGDKEAAAGGSESILECRV